MPMLSTSTLMFILYDYITDGAVWKALTAVTFQTTLFILITLLTRHTAVQSQSVYPLQRWLLPDYG